LRHHRVTDWDPYFENADGQSVNGSQNVALHLGATALLDCRVAMLSGKKVTLSDKYYQNPHKHRRDYYKVEPSRLSADESSRAVPPFAVIERHFFTRCVTFNSLRMIDKRLSRITGDVATTEHRLAIASNSW